MAPKNPIPKNPGAPRHPIDISAPPAIPRLEFPGAIRPAGPETRAPDQPLVTLPGSSNTLSTIQIQDRLPTIRESESLSTREPHPTESIRHYGLAPQVLAQLPGANAEGLRVHRGRIYAEVQFTTTMTVMVEWDEGAGTYRAKRQQESRPSGPPLHFDTQSNTWRVGDPPDTRPLIESVIHRQADNSQDIPAQGPAPQASSNTALVYIDIRNYVWDSSTTHHHGYVVMHRKMRKDDSVGPPSHHAFRDDSGAFVRVDPPSYPINQPAELLPAWTDRDIWDLYGLQGEDIARFRTEAERTHKKPQWATVRTQRMENAYLFEELYRWSGQDMDRDMFISLLAHQKRTPAEWVKNLESVTLHRNAPAPQPPLSRLPAPDTPPSRHLTPDSPETTDSTPAYGDQRYYTWDLDKPNNHGYVEMKRKPELDDSYGPLTQMAFPDGSDLTIVRPIKYSVSQRAFRPYWRDIDIWNLYRIEGEDILRFRQDVALHLKQPEWVKQRELPSRREEMLEYLRLWTNPDSPLKSREQIIDRFRPYNLSIRQLVRLGTELSPTGQFNKRINDEVPKWVENQQARTLVATDKKLFDPFLPELHDEIIRLRNMGEGNSLMKASLTRPFFQELLLRGGFKRNRQDYLYRTDIPAMFAMSNRTPFEIARPGALLPQTFSVAGTTSEVPFSAMFRLRTAMDFANETIKVVAPRPTAPQTGNEPHQKDSRPSTPPSQRIRFCYLLDTRDHEVVSGQDNRAYNSAPLNRSPSDNKTMFPSMKMEGHVSMSRNGFTSRRVWMVNSAMTRAALVDDVHLQAGEQAAGSSQDPVTAIEARTRAGELNRHEYDALIDEVAKAGKRVIALPAGKDIFSNDIVFPA
ncbi:hypothetical protein [Pseudomonas sp. UV AK001]|uniref:hypothetical protein n=1 Tax=Pseudomonas sp. UV AK001 TaxID=3384791 RepID=UPI0038D4568A